MERKANSFQPTPQEHSMGCAVACVASLCRVSYREAIELFETPEHAWTRGFYCSEIVKALGRAGFEYSYAEFKSSRHFRRTQRPGTIVFVAPCSKYPAGHFFLRSSEGWMNPWLNYPWMDQVRSAVERHLPGRISYLVYEKES